MEKLIVLPFTTKFTDLSLLDTGNAKIVIADTEESYYELLKQAHGCVAWMTWPIRREFIDLKNCVNLKVVSSFGTGYDHIDVQMAKENGIMVTHVPEVPSKATSVIALNLMLNVCRRTSEFERELRERRNTSFAGDVRFYGHDPDGKVMGIIGMGSIARLFLELLKPFNMTVIYTKRTKLDDEEEKELGIRYVSLEELLEESDFISVHAPKTPDTIHMLSYPQFDMMKDGVFIINTSRGPLVDEQALVDNLKSGKVGGAGLDVFENEPQIHDDLFNFPNVVLFPHIGSATIETRTKMERCYLDNVITMVNEGTAINPVPEI